MEKITELNRYYTGLPSFIKIRSRIKNVCYIYELYCDKSQYTKIHVALTRLAKIFEYDNHSHIESKNISV